jgi:hypothetical protein
MRPRAACQGCRTLQRDLQVAIRGLLQLWHQYRGREAPSPHPQRVSTRTRSPRDCPPRGRTPQPPARHELARYARGCRCWAATSGKARNSRQPRLRRRGSRGQRVRAGHRSPLRGKDSRPPAGRQPARDATANQPHDVQAEADHRRHAIIEQVIADLEAAGPSALRQLRGQLGLARTGRDRVQPHPRRRIPRVDLLRQGHHRDHPSTADQHRRSHHPLRAPQQTATASSLALDHRLAAPVHHRHRTTDHGLTRPPPPGPTRDPSGKAEQIGGVDAAKITITVDAKGSLGYELPLADLDNR